MFTWNRPSLIESGHSSRKTKVIEGTRTVKVRHFIINAITCVAEAVHHKADVIANKAAHRDGSVARTQGARDGIRRALVAPEGHGQIGPHCPINEVGVVGICAIGLAPTPIQPARDPAVQIRAHGVCPENGILGDVIIVVVGVHAPAGNELLQVIHAGDLLRPALGSSQGRQQHCGKDRDDRNDHEQLDQRESASSARGFGLSIGLDRWSMTAASTIVSRIGSHMNM